MDTLHTITHLKQRGAKNSVTTTYVPPRDSKAYKDYIRELQQKQTLSRLSGSRTKGRPYKSDTLEMLYKREEHCKSSIMSELKSQSFYKQQIIELNSSIDISKTHLENPEQFKKHVRQYTIESIRESIIEKEKMVAQFKEMEETLALSIKNLQKTRADNWAEIELRKSGK